MAKRRNLTQASRSTSRVAMVQTANLRNGNDLTFGRRLNATWVRRVAIQGQVAAGVVIVVEVLAENAMQVLFVEHDDMIQTVVTYTADGALAIRILPRRARCCWDFFDAHAFHAFLEVVAVDAVVVAAKPTEPTNVPRRERNATRANVAKTRESTRYRSRYDLPPREIPLLDRSPCADLAHP